MCNEFEAISRPARTKQYIASTECGAPRTTESSSNTTTEPQRKEDVRNSSALNSPAQAPSAMKLGPSSTPLPARISTPPSVIVIAQVLGRVIFLPEHFRQHLGDQLLSFNIKGNRHSLVR